MKNYRNNVVKDHKCHCGYVTGAFLLDEKICAGKVDA